MRAIGLDPAARGTIAEFGRATGVPASTLSRWLSGSVQPTIPMLRDIAPVLKIRIIDLLIVAGHLEPTETADAEEHIAHTPGLSEGQRHELLGYLARMREKTGYNDRAERDEPAPDGGSESTSGGADNWRDETG